MKNYSIPIVFKRRKDVLEGWARKEAVFAGEGHPIAEYLSPCIICPHFSITFIFWGVIFPYRQTITLPEMGGY